MTTRKSTKSRGGPTIHVHFGGGRRKRSRRAKAGFAAALWTMFAALFGLIGLLLDLTSLIIVGIIALIAALIAALVAWRAGRQGGQGSGNQGPSIANPRNTTGPSVQTGRRKPIAGSRARACGRACQTSKQDRSTCDCSCGGANHGRLATRKVPPKPTKRRAPAGGTGGGTGTRKPAAKPAVNTRKRTP